MKEQYATPLFDNLKVAPDSYGTSHFGQLYDSAIARFQMLDSAEILALMAGPGSGKTTLAGELLAKTSQRLSTSDQEVGLDQLAYVTFEDCAKAGKDLGLIDRNHQWGSYTEQEYTQMINVQQRAFALAVSTPRIVIAETVGTTGIVHNGVQYGVDRGSSTLLNLVRRNGQFSDLNYNISIAMITAEPPVTAVTYIVREQMEKLASAEDRIAFLSDSGIAVHVGEQGITNLAGGHMKGVLGTERDENRVLFALQEMGLLTLPPELKHETIEEMSMRAFRLKAIRKQFAPWYLGVYLGIDPERAVVSVNEISNQVHLYQDHLDKYNFINHLRTTNQVDLLAA